MSHGFHLRPIGMYNRLEITYYAVNIPNSAPRAETGPIGFYNSPMRQIKTFH